MEYWWRYDDGPARSAGFASRAAAEEWLAAAWADLRDQSVDAVSLIAGDDSGDDVVFGPMSLHPSEQ